MAYKGYNNPTDPLREVYGYLKRKNKNHVWIKGYEYKNVNAPYILISLTGGEGEVADNMLVDSFEAVITLELFDVAGPEIQILDQVDALYKDIKDMIYENVINPDGITFFHSGVVDNLDCWMFTISFSG